MICSANHWTGFYMITASVKKELKYVYISVVSTFKTEIDMNNKIILIAYQFFSSENFCIISLVYLDIRYDCISIKYSRSDL